MRRDGQILLARSLLLTFLTFSAFPFGTQVALQNKSGTSCELSSNCMVVYMKSPLIQLLHFLQANLLTIRRPRSCPRLAATISPSIFCFLAVGFDAGSSGCDQSEPALVLELMLELGLALLALLALLATSSLDLVCILAIPRSGFACS